LNKHSKRGSDDFIRSIGNTHKLPKIVEKRAHETHNNNSSRGITNNSNQGIDEYNCDIRKTNKHPKMGEKGTCKTQTQQYRIGMMNDEISLLRKQVALLSKRVIFLEKQHSERKESNGTDYNLSLSVRPDLLSKVMYSSENSVGQSEITHHTPNSKSSLQHAYEPTTPPRKSSPGLTQLGTKYVTIKPSLHDFSKNLETSLQDITYLDNPEDFLFDKLTKSEQPGRNKT